MHTAGSEQFSLGTNVVLKLHSDEEVTGEVFASDKQRVVLLEPGSKQTLKNLRLLKTEHIKAVNSKTPPSSDNPTRLPHIDLGKAREREARAVQAADLEVSRKGQGVTEEAQLIFDSLVKTMPCRWKGKSIIVLGEVSIEEPYNLASMSASLPGDVSTLDRVGKVLEAERKRLGLDP